MTEYMCLHNSSCISRALLLPGRMIDYVIVCFLICLFEVIHGCSVATSYFTINLPKANFVLHMQSGPIINFAKIRMHGPVSLHC